MKTKAELLEKYKNNKDYYGIIKTHYGTNESFQDYDGGIPTFDRNALEGIVGAEKIT